MVTQAGCAWTASGGAAWTSITTGAGSGSGDVVFTVQPNADAQTRATTISAGGQSHAVTQAAAAAPVCTYALDPTSQTVSASGGDARFRVVTQAGCAWTASGGAAWATIVTAAGTGTGDVVVTVQANTAAQTRAATITAGGQSHALTQAAPRRRSAPTRSIRRRRRSSASGGDARFRVVTQAGCAWTASGGAAWTSLTTSAGSGSGDVVFTVQANTATQTRAATITAGGQSHALTQAAAAAPVCTYSLDPASQTVAASGGTGTLPRGDAGRVRMDGLRRRRVDDDHHGLGNWQRGRGVHGAAEHGRADTRSDDRRRWSVSRADAGRCASGVAVNQARG